MAVPLRLAFGSKKEFRRHFCLHFDYYTEKSEKIQKLKLVGFNPPTSCLNIFEKQFVKVSDEGHFYSKVYNEKEKKPWVVTQSLDSNHHFLFGKIMSDITSKRK